MKNAMSIPVLTFLATLLVAAWFATAQTAAASDPIVLDGEFNDWTGEGNVVDPAGDAGGDQFDMTAFWWADNADDSHLYWRIDRQSHKKKVTYALYLDANNNGDFTENVDRELEIGYSPKGSGAHVDIVVKFADTQAEISSTKNND